MALSSATDATLGPAPSAALARLGGELKPFQRAGVAYLLEQRRAFLADEQGLGKTIEALATLEADDAYPAIVVCPASLKLNWMREIERWLPGRSAQALSGTGSRRMRTDNPDTGRPGASAQGAHGDAKGTPIPPADITVVNYDILAARAQTLGAMRRARSCSTSRTTARTPPPSAPRPWRSLASSVPTDGLVLALTGTPVMNRPPELIAQLRILGRLADFGSGAQFGRRFRGADAHVRLHWHLRARCFVRRLKVDVLPQLPAKTRTVVPVELDNEARVPARRDGRDRLATQPAPGLERARRQGRRGAAC